MIDIKENIMTKLQKLYSPHTKYRQAINGPRSLWKNLVALVIYHPHAKYSLKGLNTALAITGTIKGTSQIKLYNELGLESFEFR